MTTLPASSLSEPKGANKVPLGTLAYFRARLKHRIYSLVVKEFKSSGLTQADLARRLAMEPAQLSRLLSGPGNLTLETVSDLLFATSAAELESSIGHPLAARNHGVLDHQTKFLNASPVPLQPAIPTTSRPTQAFIVSLRTQGAPVPVAA